MSIKDDLLTAGEDRIVMFCKVNKIPCPDIWENERSEWRFSHVCAYYRPKEGIQICSALCSFPSSQEQRRSWSWPGSTSDKTPFGVICHELGHHCDWVASSKKGSYFGDYSIKVRSISREESITGYCDNDAEWFAEMFRVFVTNHALLFALRPATWEVLRKRWIPVSKPDWREELGSDCPPRILKSLFNKGAR